MKVAIKKTAAALLALLLVITMLPADITSAAIKTPELSAKSKVITIGKTTKLTVKNKVKGASYKWSTKNSKIARVSQKGTVRGVAAGKTTIVCKMKTGKKNYTLNCKVTVKAAEVAPVFSETAKSVPVGSTTKLTVQNKISGASYKWSSKNPKIARVSQKGTVRGVTAGKTSIICKVKNGKKNYTLTCTITVTDPSQTSQTVSTQQELNAALKKATLSKLTIQTKESVTLEIPAGNYNKIALIVDAPNADVHNSGIFQSIEIKAIKDNTWIEKAKGNSFSILADVARIVVDASAKISNLAINQGASSVKIEAKGSIENVAVNADSKIDLTVDGTVGKLAVNAPAKLDVKGDSKQAIPVAVSEAAKGAELTASTAVDVKTEASVSLKLEKGAEGSKIAGTKKNAEIALKNDTTEKIVIETPSGNKEVGTGESVTHTVSEATSTDPGSSSWSGTENHVSLKGVSGDGPEKTVQVGSQITLTPIFEPENATNKKVFWSIANSAIASIDNNGTITGKKTGTTTVTVRTDQMGYTYTWTINVTEAVLSGIELSEDYNELYVDEIVYFKASAIPNAANLPVITWTSSNPSVATVNASTGMVTGVASGSAIITAQSGAFSASKELQVLDRPENSIQLTFYNGSETHAVIYVESGTKMETIMNDSIYEPKGADGDFFKGWSTTPSGTVNVDNNTVITEATSYYAVFEKKKCYIIFPYTGKNVEVNYGDPYTMPDGETKEGYDFLGWATCENASLPEVKAGETITCKETTLLYYPVYIVHMIKITQIGDHVKFYTGALKDQNNVNLEYNADGTLKNSDNTGYISYSGGDSNVMELRFAAENGYAITGITLDGNNHSISDTPASGESKNFVQKAVAQGYVVVNRKTDHSIAIKTTPISVIVTPKDENVFYKTVENNGTTYHNYTVTGSAISISDVITVQVNGLDGYNPEITYKYGDNNTSGNDFAEIGPDEKKLTLLDAGKHWQVMIIVKSDDVILSNNFIHVYLIAPK